MKAYELTEQQYEGLSFSAKEAKAFFVQEPNPTGTLEEREEQAKLIGMMVDLVHLDLMMDVTENHKTLVDKFIETYGHGIRSFMVTPDGYQLFKRENLVVN